MTAKGFFKKNEKIEGPNINQAMTQVNTIDQRLRLLEGRYTDLNRKVQLTDKNILNERKLITNEIKVINSEILELKREIHEIKNKQELIITELKGCARKEDLEVLRKYINLWEPINFVTRNELDKLLEEK